MSDSCDIGLFSSSDSDDSTNMASLMEGRVAAADTEVICEASIGVHSSTRPTLRLWTSSESIIRLGSSAEKGLLLGGVTIPLLEDKVCSSMGGSEERTDILDWIGLFEDDAFSPP